ncbi:hypothetical protein [Actinophytocola glycyrrhizae]|uniref:Mce-associated membrane protein n=1 Tax=Actinophytocola glycyrrhizae TaxID=2044873 RepID=A0ABV9RZN0_9PSEU
MPPHRRRPAPNTGQAPPIRRPKVAGLRNRPGRQAEDATEQTTDQTTDQPAVTEEESERVSGVLAGVLGQAPERAGDEQDEQEESAARRAAAEPPPAVADEDHGIAEDEDQDQDEEPAEPARKPRPGPGSRPAGKRRSTGSARPDDLASAETGAAQRRARRERAGAGATRTRGQRHSAAAMVLVVVAVVFVALAVFFRGQADDLTSGDTNTALTDPAATSQIKGQLTNAIKQTFSYNYTDLDSTEKAVKENLVGKALCEYNLLFGEVKEYAPEQKIVLDTTVRELALVRVDGDRAEALVYIDQLSTRVDVNKTVAVGGQFAVQAAKDGDHWKITEFDMFGQPLFNGKPAPKC